VNCRNSLPKAVHPLGMLNKLACAATAAVAMLGVTSKAHAAPLWHLSPEIGYINGACNLGANLGMTTRVGYYGETAPRTGDNPNSALLIKVTAACGPVTAVPNFRLPAEVRRDTSFPIECTRVRANGTREALKTDMQGGCSQFPLQNPWNLPNVFGWAGLAIGESLEVYMPIEYISVATPASFSAEVRHSIQQNDPLFPIIQFNIGYAARFKNYGSTNKGTGFGSRLGSWDGERVDISFALYHYFQSGNLVIEYGTTPSFGSNLGTTPVPTGSEYYPNVTASFTGLAENTQYYWRPKYITTYGTFYGDTQTFRTYAYLRLPRPTCPRYPCSLP
jgi:hypothetical protein